MPFATENAIQAAQLDIIEEALLDLDAPSALLSILADLRLEKGFEQPQSIGSALLRRRILASTYEYFAQLKEKDFLSLSRRQQPFVQFKRLFGRYPEPPEDDKRSRKFYDNFFAKIKYQIYFQQCLTALRQLDLSKQSAAKTYTKYVHTLFASPVDGDSSKVVAVYANLLQEELLEVVDTESMLFKSKTSVLDFVETFPVELWVSKRIKPMFQKFARNMIGETRLKRFLKDGDRRDIALDADGELALADSVYLSPVSKMTRNIKKCRSRSARNSRNNTPSSETGKRLKNQNEGRRGFREAVAASRKVHDGYPLSSSEESSIDLEEAWGTTEQSGDDSSPRDLIITEEDRKKIRLLNQKINENKKKRSGTGSFSTPQSKRQKRGRYINPSQEGEEIQFSPNEDTTSSNNHSRTAGGSSSKSDKEVPPKNLAIARISTPTSERGIRKRMRWTKEETDILIAGVQAHGRGCWAAILRDPKSAFLRERGRTQVNLKDKWRTLKTQGKV